MERVTPAPTNPPLDLNELERHARAATPGPWMRLSPNVVLALIARLREAEAATSYGKLGEGPWPAAWAALEAPATRAEAERDKLMAAIEPFVKAADLYFEHDGHLIVAGTEMSIGDLRTAARVYAEAKASAKQDEFTPPPAAPAPPT